MIDCFLPKQCPLENVVNEKLFDKFSKRFYRLYEEELEGIKSAGLKYLDEEFRDIYQRIGVDVPEDGEVKRSRSRGKCRVNSSDEEEEEQEEVDEDEDEQPHGDEESDVTQNG